MRFRFCWWLVQDQTIQAQLLDGLRKLSKVNRFAYIAVDAQVIAGGQVLLFFGRGEHHHRQAPRPLVSANASQDLQAVHFRQLEVQQDEGGQLGDVPAGICALAIEIIQRFLPVLDHYQLVGNVAFTQCTFGQLNIAGVVFY
jgi:hypothetical protein